MDKHQGSTILETMCALFFVTLIVSMVISIDTMIDASHQRTQDYALSQMACINLAETLSQDIEQGVYILAYDYSYRTPELSMTVSITENTLYNAPLYFVTANVEAGDTKVSNQFCLGGGSQ